MDTEWAFAIDDPADVDDPDCVCLDSFAAAREISRLGDGPHEQQEEEADDE